jgi:hypothetical protein
LRVKFDTSLNINSNDALSAVESQTLNYQHLIATQTNLTLKDNNVNELNLTDMVNFLFDLFSQLDINVNILHKINVQSTNDDISSSTIKQQLLV